MHNIWPLCKSARHKNQQQPTLWKIVHYPELINDSLTHKTNVRAQEKSVCSVPWIMEAAVFVSCYCNYLGVNRRVWVCGISRYRVHEVAHSPGNAIVSLGNPPRWTTKTRARFHTIWFSVLPHDFLSHTEAICSLCIPEGRVQSSSI